jgi:cysteine desulfurase family protein (TIGR01976 family)
MIDIEPAQKAISTAEIRRHFPALERRHNGHPVAYFDGPGGTQVPRAVVDAMADYLYHHNANTHWAYPTSAETDAIVEESRATVGEFLNAGPEEVAFGANMTTLTFHLARALGRSYQPGDEIVVTELEHHANVAPWQALATERGVTVRVAKMIRDRGVLDWDDFERQLNRRTKLVAIGAASNALGTVTDVTRASEMARAVGAQVFVDAVAYAPHELVDVRQIDCDFLSCSAYKFYGPHIGVLYGRHDLLASIDFPKLIPAPDTAPERVETGTPSFEGMAGAAAAVDFLASVGSGATRRDRLRAAFTELHERGEQLVRRLWDGLSDIDGVTLHGPPPDEPRTPTVSFTVEGVSADDVSRRLAEQGVFASSGDFYARTVVECLGCAEHGLLRAGCACYTTAEELDRLIAAVSTIVDKR